MSYNVIYPGRGSSFSIKTPLQEVLFREFLSDLDNMCFSIRGAKISVSAFLQMFFQKKYSCLSIGFYSSDFIAFLQQITQSI